MNGTRHEANEPQSMQGTASSLAELARRAGSDGKVALTVIVPYSGREGFDSIVTQLVGKEHPGEEESAVEKRLQSLERRVASRLDLSQFGRLTLRQITQLAGQSYEGTRKTWRRRCSGCLVRGRGRHGAHLYDPWAVAQVLLDLGMAPRWGALAVQRCTKAVVAARRLDGEQRAALEGLLQGWYETYSPPAGFVGARDEDDRQSIKAQVALHITEFAGQGSGDLTADEFDKAVKQAEARALQWWRQDVLRSRSRENPLAEKDRYGEDVAGRLDGFDSSGGAESEDWGGDDEQQA